jgi:hypothetical protein
MEGKNPNETILIPLLNKRVTELTTANILTEAKLLYAEEEKKELQDALEAEKVRVVEAAESEKARFTEALQEQTQIIRNACEQEKKQLHETAEASKHTIAQNWQNELNVQTGNLKAQIQGLNSQLEAANAKIAALEKELAVFVPVSAPVAESEKPASKRKGKKEAAVMGGDTY